jgi:hypothetical protein
MFQYLLRSQIDHHLLTFGGIAILGVRNVSLSCEGPRLSLVRTANSSPQKYFDLERMWCRN